MKLLFALLLVVSTALPAIAGKRSDAEQKELEAWAQGLDRESVHRAVQDHERDPLGEHARKIRPVLAVHFEPLDYIVCLDQIGPLLDTKKKPHEAVFWQVVFGSGDFVEQYPDRAKDKFAYMVAGLESGLRAYEIILKTQPKARHKLLDDLLPLRDTGRLLEFVQAHPCDDK